MFALCDAWSRLIKDLVVAYLRDVVFDSVGMVGYEALFVVGVVVGAF